MPANNQPLSQHPKPLLSLLHTLGAQMAAYEDAAAADTLVIPAPPEGVARLAMSPFFRSVAVENDSGAPITDASLVFKDGSGNETTLVSATGAPLIADGAGITLGFSGGGPPFFLMPGDGGLFLRYAGGAATGVSARAKWQDVRGVERATAELGAVAVNAFPPPAAAGLVHGSLELLGTAEWLMNFDAGNVATPTVTYSDGTTTVPVNEAAAAQPAEGSPLITDGAGFYVGVGGSLNVSVAGSTSAQLYTFYTTHNESPVRQDQGGAY